MENILSWIFKGGLTPGSMPPSSTKLTEEGACFKSFKLVRNGVFAEKGIASLCFIKDFWKKKIYQF